MTTKYWLAGAAALAMMIGAALAQGTSSAPMTNPSANSTLGTGIDNRGSSSAEHTQSQTSGGSSVGAGSPQATESTGPSGDAASTPNSAYSPERKQSRPNVGASVGAGSPKATESTGVSGNVAEMPNDHGGTNPSGPTSTLPGVRGSNNAQH